MKRTVLFTHGGLCEGFRSAMTVIGAGEPEELYTMSMVEGEAPETAEAELRGILSQFDENDVIILLTDIPFGSTTQVAIPFLAEFNNLFIATGTTLALLMAVLMEDFDEGDPADHLRELCEQSKGTVSFINDMLKDAE